MSEQLKEEAAALTDDDLRALRFARAVVEAHLFPDSVHGYREYSEQALAALDKVLARGPR